MKLTKLLALSSLLLGAVTVEAQQDNPLFVTISARIIAQSTNTTTSHDVTTTPAARSRFFSTTDFLKRLAIDENNAANWPSNTFPRNVRLAVVGDKFSVVLGTNVLVDVSNIIGIEFGNSTIMSGRQNDTNNLASPTITTMHIAKLNFDDTALNPTNGLRFFMQGLLTETVTDSTISRTTSTFTETQTASLPSAAGEGSGAVGSGSDQPILVTGSLSASGSGKVLFVP